MRLFFYQSRLFFSCDVPLIERAQGGRIAAQDHGRQDAEQEIDASERERDGKRAQEGKKHDGKSRDRACDMTCHAVIGFDEESADVGTAVGLADLVLMEAREATPFGDVFFPGIDLELAVKLALGLPHREKPCFGREPFFGQTAREKSHS